MKYVIYTSYEGFHVPDEISHILEDNPDARVNPILIEWVENHPDRDFEIVDIPKEATDYDIFESDGVETLFYVLDGQIIRAN